MTEDEFLAAAKQLMVAKVFAAARRKQAPRVALVDFGLDDIDIGDSIEVTKAWLARPSTKRTRWVEIRGDETALRLLGIECAPPAGARRCIKTVAAPEGGALRNARADCGS